MDDMEPAAKVFKRNCSSACAVLGWAGLGWVGLGWAGAGQVYECKVVSNQSQGRDQGPYPDQARAAQSVCTHTGGTTHCRRDGNSNPHLNYYCLGQRFILGS